MNTFKKLALTVSALGLISSANAAEYFIDLGASEGINGLTNTLFTGTFDGSTGAVIGNSATYNNAAGTGVSVSLGNGITFTTSNVGGYAFAESANAATTQALTHDYILVNADGWGGGPVPTATFTVSGVKATDTVTVEFVSGSHNPASKASFNGSALTTTNTTGFTQLGTAATGSTEYSGVLGTGTEEHTFSAVRVTVTETAAVPEPSSTALLGLGSLALILRRRR